MTDFFQLQGAIIAGSLLQMSLGFFGIMGFIFRSAGPLAVCPMMMLEGFSLMEISHTYV